MSSADPPGDTPLRDCVDRIWDMRAELWAGEGYDRLDTIVTDAYAAGAAQAARDERQRIYEWLLARETELIHPETAEEVAAVRWRDIADLLRGAETTGD